jgi:DNA-binding response OmpR family regulator
MAKKVLICDDEPSILRAAEFKFQRAGYEVATATDGEEGWQLLLANPPDVVVTDCQMPRTDGIELARRIKQHEQTRSIPVLMLTAKGFELPADELREQYGVWEVVCKPFSPRELVERVERILERCAAAIATS